VLLQIALLVDHMDLTKRGYFPSTAKPLDHVLLHTRRRYLAEPAPPTPRELLGLRQFTGMALERSQLWLRGLHLSKVRES